MTPFMVELYKMATGMDFQPGPQDKPPVPGVQPPKTNSLGKPPSGAKGGPTWNNGNAQPVGPNQYNKLSAAQNCGGKGQPTCETIKGETEEQRRKRLLREGSEEGLLSGKQSSGAAALYSHYCDVMNQLYGG